MYEISGSEVLKVKEVVTPTQTAIVRTFHDMCYHLRLTQDGDTVTAHVYDYLGTRQYADGVEVTFGAADWTQTVETVGGEASITVPEGAVEVTATVPGYRAGLITKGS